MVELLLKLSFDLRLIATKQYSKSVEITGEVGKQAGGEVDSRYIRRSTVQKCFSKIEGMCRAKTDPEKVREVAHSYFGILSHADAWKEQGKLTTALYRAGYGEAVPKKLNDARFPR